MFSDEDPLSKLRLKDRDKIMVLGHRKPEPEEDEAMRALKKIELSIVQGINEKMSLLDSELDGIEKVQRYVPYLLLQRYIFSRRKYVLNWLRNGLAVFQ